MRRPNRLTITAAVAAALLAALPALDQRRGAAALCKLWKTAATCVASLTSRQRQILDEESSRGGGFVQLTGWSLSPPGTTRRG